jgi:hypothetical protein
MGGTRVAPTPQHNACTHTHTPSNHTKGVVTIIKKKRKKTRKLLIKMGFWIFQMSSSFWRMS